MVRDETQLSRGAFFYLAPLSHNSITDLALKRQSLGPTDAETCPLGLCLINQIDLEAGVFAFTSQTERRQEMTRSNPLKDRKLRDKMFFQGMLWCSKCRQFFPIKDFGPTSTDSRNYGYRGRCLRCEKTHKIKTTDQRSDYFKKRNNALKAQFVELAGGKCQRCGYDGFIAALDFHHVYPAQKKYNPTRIIYSNNFEKAWRELDKCCLLCQNCHIAYTARMWRAEFVRRGPDLLGFTIGADLPLGDKRYESEKPPAYNQAPLPLFTYEQKNLQLTLFDQPARYGMV